MWWWFSNIVVLVGSAAYASVRQREMADKDQRSSSKVEKVLHEEESQSMVQKVLVHKICARFSNFLHMVKASLLTVVANTVLFSSIRCLIFPPAIIEYCFLFFQISFFYRSVPVVRLRQFRLFFFILPIN